MISTIEARVFTTTSYNQFIPSAEGEYFIDPRAEADSVRGALAIEFAQQTLENQSLTIVDGGSSDSFRTVLDSQGIAWHPETEKGMGGSRRQSLRHMLKDMWTSPELFIGIWSEPEKVDVIRFFPQIIQPIIDGKADIVIPRRTPASLATYPRFQIESEVQANMDLDTLLVEYGILPNLGGKNFYRYDFMFGPWAFRCTKEIIQLLTQKFDIDFDRNTEVSGRKEAELRASLGEYLRLDFYNNPTFFPRLRALFRKVPTVSLEVDFQYPKKQYEIEKDSEVMRRKRAMQKNSIVGGADRLLALLTGNYSRTSSDIGVVQQQILSGVSGFY